MTESSSNATDPGAAPDCSQVSLTKFVDRLERSRLISETILRRIHRGLVRGQYESTQILADALLEAGHLTEWQLDRLLIGRGGFHLGRYRLVDTIAAGGMGVVMKAFEASTRRYVAVKILAKRLIKREEALKRFEREIAAAGKLEHPNIVRAIDADFLDGVPYLVMEFVDGTTATGLVKRRGPLPIEWASEIIRQAACGLDHAHRTGLVHRDIKPGNLLITLTQETLGRRPTGIQVRISDFGLARFESESTEEGMGLTGANQIFGTVDFISPEQAKAARTADIRSDIYSLGCTFFYLLTGQVPFPGVNVMEKLSARLNDRPPFVRTVRPQVPRDLETLLLRMMANDPADRPRTPGEIVPDLLRFAQGNYPSDGSTPPVSEEFAAPLALRAESVAEVPLENFLEGLQQRERGRVPLRRTTASRFSRPLGLLLLTLAMTALTIFFVASRSSNTNDSPNAASPQNGWPGDALGTMFRWRTGETPLADWRLLGAAEIGPTEMLSLGDGEVIVPGMDQQIAGSCQVTNELCVELVLRPETTKNRRFLPIVGCFDDDLNANFVLGQQGGELLFRLRTPFAGERGDDPATALTRIDAGESYHLIVAYRRGELICYLNGKQVLASRGIDGDFRNWTPLPLRLGSGFESAAGWQGSVERVLLTNRFPDRDEIRTRYQLSLK